MTEPNLPFMANITQKHRDVLPHNHGIPRVGILCKNNGPRYGANTAYFRWMEDYVTPSRIEMVNALSDTIRTDIDVLVLIGGPDLEDEGGVPSSLTGTYDPRLSYFDKYILPHYWQRAVDGNLGIIGVCRGLQAVNKMLGGTITQDWPYPYSGDSRWKEVEELEYVQVGHKNTLPKFENIPHTNPFFNKIPAEHKINSLHHQGIEMHQLANGLEPIAISKEFRNVEIATNNRNGDIDAPPFFIGCQYHPEEMQYHRENTLLFTNYFHALGMRTLSDHR